MTYGHQMLQTGASKGVDPNETNQDVTSCQDHVTWRKTL